MLLFVGELEVVFLDELLIGMDFEARRFMWDVILFMMVGCMIVFILYFMEECEVFCNCIGIMVSGEFKCFGFL